MSALMIQSFKILKEIKLVAKVGIVFEFAHFI